MLLNSILFKAIMFLIIILNLLLFTMQTNMLFNIELYIINFVLNNIIKCEKSKLTI